MPSEVRMWPAVWNLKPNSRLKLPFDPLFGTRYPLHTLCIYRSFGLPGSSSHLYPFISTALPTVTSAISIPLRPATLGSTVPLPRAAPCTFLFFIPHPPP